MVATMVPLNATIVDVGTDHAYLPIELVSSKRIKEAWAVDVQPGPLRAAEANVAKAGLTAQIHCLLSDGLQKVEAPYDCLTIAGLGGATIVEILIAAGAKLQKADRLVIQANNATPKVREYLVSQGYRIEDERIVYEGELYYEVLSFVKGQAKYTEQEYRFGPVLLARPDPLLADLIRMEIEHDTYVYQHIPATELARRKVFEQNIKKAQQVLLSLTTK